MLYLNQLYTKVDLSYPSDAPLGDRNGGIMFGLKKENNIYIFEAVVHTEQLYLNLYEGNKKVRQIAFDPYERIGDVWRLEVAEDISRLSYCYEADGQVFTDPNGTVFEGFTGDECLSGISPVQGTELCSIVEQMYSYEQLFAFTGDNKWAERLEVLAFNALPATISEDMWSHQYDQMVNQIACIKLFPFSHFGTNGPRAHLFGLEPNFGCCTANFNQGFPKLALSAFMHSQGRIINSVMLPSELKAEGVSIELKTDYPFENKARYIINAQREFDFVIRIPSFAKNVRVNKKAFKTEDVEIRVKEGETDIELEFDVDVRLTDRPNKFKAVRAGSLIFSLPVPFEEKRIEYIRNGVERKYPYCDYELLPKGDWNYAFCSDDFSLKFNGVGEYPFSKDKPPVTVVADMQKINWGTRIKLKSVCRKTPKSLKPISDIEKAELFPYGCAKLRMTEMPLIK